MAETLKNSAVFKNRIYKVRDFDILVRAHPMITEIYDIKINLIVPSYSDYDVLNVPIRSTDVISDITNVSKEDTQSFFSTYESKAGQLIQSSFISPDLRATEPFSERLNRPLGKFDNLKAITSNEISFAPSDYYVAVDFSDVPVNDMQLAVPGIYCVICASTSADTNATSSAMLPSYFNFNTIYYDGVLKEFSLPTNIKDFYCSLYIFFLYVPTSKMYYFGVDGDDAVEIQVDDTIVAGKYGGGALGTPTGAGIDLVAGYHKIIVRHNEGSGGDSCTAYFRFTDVAAWEVINVANCEAKGLKFVTMNFSREEMVEEGTNFAVIPSRIDDISLASMLLVDYYPLAMLARPRSVLLAKELKNIVFPIKPSLISIETILEGTVENLSSSYTFGVGTSNGIIVDPTKNISITYDTNHKVDSILISETKRVDVTADDNNPSTTLIFACKDYTFNFYNSLALRESIIDLDNSYNIDSIVINDDQSIRLVKKQKDGNTLIAFKYSLDVIELILGTYQHATAEWGYITQITAYQNSAQIKLTDSKNSFADLSNEYMDSVKYSDISTIPSIFKPESVPYDVKIGSEYIMYVLDTSTDFPEIETYGNTYSYKNESDVTQTNISTVINVYKMSVDYRKINVYGDIDKNTLSTWSYFAHDTIKDESVATDFSSFTVRVINSSTSLTNYGIDIRVPNVAFGYTAVDQNAVSIPVCGINGDGTRTSDPVAWNGNKIRIKLTSLAPKEVNVITFTRGDFSSTSLLPASSGTYIDATAQSSWSDDHKPMSAYFYNYAVKSGLPRWEILDDSFTGSDNSLPNTNLWIDVTASGLWRIQSNKLRLSSSNTTQTLESKYKIMDDFIVQVDFNTNTTADSGTWAFRLQSKSTLSNSMSVIQIEYNTARRYMSNIMTNSSWGTQTVSNTTNTTGTLRLRRKGKIIYSEFWSGTNWTLLGTHTYTNVEPMQISLVSINTSGTVSTFDIDRYTVSKGEVMWIGAIPSIADPNLKDHPNKGDFICCELDNWGPKNIGIQIWTILPIISPYYPTKLTVLYSDNQPNNIFTIGESKDPSIALVVNINSEGTYDTLYVGQPTVKLDEGIYKMWYMGSDAINERILYAESVDGFTWTDHQMIINVGFEGNLDVNGVSNPDVVKDGSTYKMWYTGKKNIFKCVCYAESVDGINWTNGQVAINRGHEGTYDTLEAWSASVIKDGSTYKMWYTGFNGICHRILYTESEDGIAWDNQQLVLDIGAQGEYDIKGVKDPLVIKEDGKYIMWYTGVDDEDAHVLYTTSVDGITWEHHSLAMSAKHEGTYDTSYLSAIAALNTSEIFRIWYTAYDGTHFRIVHTYFIEGINYMTPSQFVWDEHYDAIWHMTQYPVVDTACIWDSTYYAYHATAKGTLSNDNLVDALVGKGYRFSETNDYAQTNVDLGSQWEITAVFSMPLPTGNADWYTLIRGTTHHAVIIRKSDYQLGVYNNPTVGFVGSGFFVNTLSSGLYQLRVVGRDGVTEFYINGTYVGTSNFQATDDIITIGNCISGGQPFSNIVDEVRVSKIIKSNSWSKLATDTSADNLFSFANAVDPLWEYGFELTLDQTALPRNEIFAFPALVNLSTTSGTNNFDASNVYAVLDYPITNGFTGTDGALASPYLWDNLVKGASNSTATILSNKLRLQVFSATAAYTSEMLSKFKFAGDFDISIPFSSYTRSNASAHLLMRIQISSDTGGYAFIGANPTNGFWSRIQRAGQSNTDATAARTNTYGSFRIVRSGTTITLYRTDGAGTSTQLQTGTLDNADVRIALSAYSDNISQTGYCDFGDITVASGSICWSYGTQPNRKKFAVHFTDAKISDLNDTFAGVDDSTLHPKLWNTAGDYTTKIKDNRAFIDLTQDGFDKGSIISKYKIVDDFDVSVEYDIAQSTYTAGWYAGISLVIASGYGDIEYSMQRSDGGYYIAKERDLVGIYNVKQSATTIHKSGKLRIARAHTTISVYYWNNESWVKLYEWINASNLDGYIRLNAQAIGDLQLSAPAISCSLIQTPFALVKVNEIESNKNFNMFAFSSDTPVLNTAGFEDIKLNITLGRVFVTETSGNDTGPINITIDVTSIVTAYGRLPMIVIDGNTRQALQTVLVNSNGSYTSDWISWNGNKIIFSHLGLNGGESVEFYIRMRNIVSDPALFSGTYANVNSKVELPETNLKPVNRITSLIDLRTLPGTPVILYKYLGIDETLSSSIT